MLRANFKNNGQSIRFTDDWCDGSGLPMIHYNQDVNSPLFSVTAISLKNETKVVKRTVEAKKLFRTVKNEVEEPITEYWLELTYKPYSYDEKVVTKKIVVLNNEIHSAKQVVSYIDSLLEKRKQHKEAIMAAKREKYASRRVTEQQRLDNCEYDVVVIDFETTGIKNPLENEKYDEILSVSIIDQDGNVLLNTLCKPQKRKSWASAQEIHGISPAMVKNQPTFEAVFPQVKEILYKAKVVIAYNIAFEMQFLWGFDLAFGKPGGTQLIRNVVWGPDPMLMYSAYKGVEKWQKLTTAAKHFKFDFSAHDSLEDVKATLHCYKKLLEYVEKHPDKDYIIKYGFLYNDGKQGKWIDYKNYTIRDDAEVDYSDPFESK